MFSRGSTRAASAALISRMLVIIRMVLGTYTSFLAEISKWKDLRPWDYLWQRKTASGLTYLSPEESERYWIESDRYGRHLRHSDVRYDRWKIRDVPPSLITYYVPRLLPVYRSARITDIDAVPYRLSAKKFCKWHHMVFCGPLHPTLRQAQMLMKNYSNRDLQEMYRISRLLSDEEVFRGAAKHTKRYKSMWTRWLNSKGPDVAIVFEKPVST